MANFSKKLEVASDDELSQWVNEGAYNVVHLASDELSRRCLQHLKAAIEENTQHLADFSRATTAFNGRTSRQTGKMIMLTRVVTVLTGVMVLGLAYQIYLAQIQVSPILSEQQRNERRAYIFCRDNDKFGNNNLSWPSATGGKILCSEVLKMLEGKY